MLSHSVKELELTRTRALIEDAARNGTASAVVGGFWSFKSPDHFYVHSAGVTRSDDGTRARPVTAQSVFDLASVSKVMGAASAYAALVERKWVDWNLRVQAVFPEYPHSDIRVSHLLSHTTGFPAWRPFWREILAEFGLPHGSLSSGPLDDFEGGEGVGARLRTISVRDRLNVAREKVFSVEPEVPVETRALYSDVSFLMLGFLIEAVTGMTFERAVDSLVLTPMGLHNTSYIRIGARPSYGDEVLSTVATERSNWRGGVLQREVHDENAWAMGGVAGHAGLFAPIHDVLLFARRWMTGHFSNETRKIAWLRMPRPAGCERTLGWDTPSQTSASCGTRFSKRSIGHLGFTGTSLWIDPDAGVAVVLLTNRVHLSREPDKIRALRPLFHDTLREELGF